MESKMPILRGRLAGKTIFVHCPYCDREHTHGWDPAETKPRHRWAHCDPGTPFEEAGYYIAPFRKTDISHPESVSYPKRMKLVEKGKEIAEFRREMKELKERRALEAGGGPASNCRDR